MANSQATVPDYFELVRSEPYLRGVSDYHAGRWTEYATPWDSSAYESGRLVAAASGKTDPTITDYFYGCEARIFPRSLGARVSNPHPELSDEQRNALTLPAGRPRTFWKMRR